MSNVVQVQLRSGPTHLTCWLEPKVRAGDQVTLKNSDNPQRRWDVLHVGTERSASAINRGWNNNI